MAGVPTIGLLIAAIIVITCGISKEDFAHGDVAGGSGFSITEDGRIKETSHRVPSDDSNAPDVVSLLSARSGFTRKHQSATPPSVSHGADTTATGVPGSPLRGDVGLIGAAQPLSARRGVGALHHRVTRTMARGAAQQLEHYSSPLSAISAQEQQMAELEAIAEFEGVGSANSHEEEGEEGAIAAQAADEEDGTWQGMEPTLTIPAPRKKIGKRRRHSRRSGSSPSGAASQGVSSSLYETWTQHEHAAEHPPQDAQSPHSWSRTLNQSAVWLDRINMFSRLFPSALMPVDRDIFEPNIEILQYGGNKTDHRPCLPIPPGFFHADRYYYDHEVARWIYEEVVLADIATAFDHLHSIQIRHALPHAFEPQIGGLFDSDLNHDPASTVYTARLHLENQLMAAWPDVQGTLLQNLWNPLGNTWRIEGDIHYAIQCYRMALHLNPEDTDAMLNLAVVVANVGHYLDAVEILLAALDLAPESILHHFVLGSILEMYGDDIRAEYYYGNANRLQPAFFPAVKSLNEIRQHRTLYRSIAVQVLWLMNAMKSRPTLTSSILLSIMGLLLVMDLQGAGDLKKKLLGQCCSSPSSAATSKKPQDSKPRNVRGRKKIRGRQRATPII